MRMFQTQCTVTLLLLVLCTLSTATKRRVMWHMSLGHDMGGVQNVWGEENLPEHPLEKFSEPSKRASGVLSLGFLHRKHRATTPGPRGGNVPDKGGGPKPVLGRGVVREVFLPHLLPPPPCRPLLQKTKQIRPKHSKIRLIQITQQPLYYANG